MHDALWSLFSAVKNKQDTEQYRQLLVPHYEEDENGQSFEFRHLRLVEAKPEDSISWLAENWARQRNGTPKSVFDKAGSLVFDENRYVGPRSVDLDIGRYLAVVQPDAALDFDLVVLGSAGETLAEDSAYRSWAWTEFEVTEKQSVVLLVQCFGAPDAEATQHRVSVWQVDEPE